MRSILSLGLTAVAASSAPSIISAETTITVLEYGPGGAVHRTTSSVTESNLAAVTSLWSVLHNTAPRTMSQQHAGMSIVPDLFTKADSGIIVSLQGESLKAMPMTTSLLDKSASKEEGNNVVGHVHLPGQASTDLIKRATTINKDDMGRRLQNTAEIAARGELEDGMETLSLTVNNDKDAAEADEHLGRMLKTLKKQATENGKTVVVHLVVEDGAPHGRRRLEDQQQNQDGEGNNNNQNNQNQNNNNNQNSNQKSMYEIQTFNLYLWTTVGLLVIVFMVIGAFINMPLMPDTLLFGETAKIGSD